MYIPKPVARWVAQDIKLRGIPEAGPILNRFFDLYWNAIALRTELIKQEYAGSENIREMDYALKVKSRAMFPMTLQTASIAMANGVSGQPLIDTVTDQLLAYGEATVADDFHDEVMMPALLKKYSYTIPVIFEMIKNPNNLRDTAELIFHSLSPGTEIPHPIDLANAALKQGEMYEKRMLARYPHVRGTYMNAKHNLFRVQAKSLFFSSALAKNDVEKIREELGRSNGGYARAVADLGDKLALIGQENAALVFEATQPANMPKGDAKKIKHGLRLFYHGSTGLKQYTEDDSKRFEKDLEKRADNLWVLLSLRKYDDISRESVRLFLKENPHVTQTVLLPCVREMREGYNKLEEVDFGVHDLQLAIGLVTRQAEKDMREFERKLHVSLDDGWLKEAIELRESF